MLLIVIWYFFIIAFCLGLGLEVLTSFNITAFHYYNRQIKLRLNVNKSNVDRSSMMMSGSVCSVIIVCHSRYC